MSIEGIIENEESGESGEYEESEEYEKSETQRHSLKIRIPINPDHQVTLLNGNQVNTPTEASEDPEEGQIDEDIVLGSLNDLESEEYDLLLKEYYNPDDSDDLDHLDSDRDTDNRNIPPSKEADSYGNEEIVTLDELELLLQKLSSMLKEPTQNNILSDNDYNFNENISFTKKAKCSFNIELNMSNDYRPKSPNFKSSST